MDHREPNDFGPGEHWMDECPGITDLADPERSDKDYDRAVYEGSLIDDCASIAGLGEELKALMAIPAPEDFFARVRRLNADEQQTLLDAFQARTVNFFARK